MATVHEIGWWRSLFARCSRPLKQGYRRHERPKYLVKSGHGAPAGVVVCRACAAPSHMAAIRKETARRG